MSGPLALAMLVAVTLDALVVQQLRMKVGYLICRPAQPMAPTVPGPVEILMRRAMRLTLSQWRRQNDVKMNSIAVLPGLLTPGQTTGYFQPSKMKLIHAPE